MQTTTIGYRFFALAVVCVCLCVYVLGHGQCWVLPCGTSPNTAASLSSTGTYPLISEVFMRLCSKDLLAVRKQGTEQDQQ